MKDERLPRVCVSRDIAEAKETKESLKLSEARFRCLVEQTADAFFAFDQEYRITEVNQIACDNLGYEREELLGLTLSDVELKFDPEEQGVTWEAFEPGVPVTVEGVHRRRDGSTFPVEVRLSLVDHDGYTRLFALVRDVSERLHVQRELIEAREAGIEASRLKSQFLANMSHEIRTPMNAIIGVTDLVLDTTLTSEQREYLQTVKSSATSLLTVIDDILDFSKIEAGKLELAEIPFQLSSCISEPLRALGPRAHEKQLELTLDLPNDVPDAVIGDPERLRQILLNLVSNGIKFTEKGHVAVRVRAETPVGATAHFHISVIDTGVGIPLDKQHSIFEGFAQVDGSTTRKFGGTGLGLAISGRLTKAMGGHIWVESEVGKGSAFHLFLPLGIQDGEPGHRDPQTAEIQRLRVVVVGGDDDSRETLTHMLWSWGMVPQEVDVAEKVVSTLRATARESPSQLVLIDHTVPDATVAALVEDLHADPLLESIPILLMVPQSGGDNVPIEQVEELGIAGVVTKPIDPTALLKTIEEVVDEPEDSALARPQRDDARPSRRVLIAEDSPVNRTVLQRILERQGHDVLAVENGQEAVAAIAQEAFDLVFMDVQMPVLDGFEATAQIRGKELETGRRVPIIALTAHAMKGDRERCLDEGMDDYLAKPIQRQEIAAVIARWAPTESSATNPPVLDPTLLEVQTGGDEDLARELAQLFLDESPELMQRLRDALSKGEAVSTEKVAHRIKGSLSTLGAVRAANAARRMEAAANRGDLEEAASLSTTLENDLGELRAELAKIIRSSASAARDGATFAR